MRSERSFFIYLFFFVRPPPRRDAIQCLRESRLILPGVCSTATPAAQLLIEAEATRDKESFRWSPRDCEREREHFTAAVGFRVGQHAFVGC